MHHVEHTMAILMILGAIAGMIAGLVKYYQTSKNAAQAARKEAARRQKAEEERIP